MQIGLSQECCLFCSFCLKSSLWSSDLPCLLVTAILDSFSLFYLPNTTISSPSLPAFNLSQHQGLSKWVSSSHQVAKVLEFQLQHQSFQWSPLHIGLISFRMDWLDLVAVQGTLKSLLQHHSSKASILWCWAFFIVQLTSIHDYWKNHSLD